MNTFKLIKNAYLMAKGSPSESLAICGLPPVADRAIRATLFMASHLATRLDPGMKPFTNSDGTTSLDAAISLGSAFTQNINRRFGGENLVILNADDPSFHESLSKVPSKYIGSAAQGFGFLTEKLNLLSIESIKRAVKAEISEVVAGMRQTSASLMQFSEAGDVSSNLQYKPFARMAFAHNVQLIETPSLSAIRRKDGGTALTVISMAGQHYDSVEKHLGIFFNKSIPEQHWFSVFAHELGHAVQPMHCVEEFNERFLGKVDTYNATWQAECYADMFSACMAAKITGNWDLLRAIELPFRAYSNNSHNTSHIIEKLLERDPAQFCRVDDKDMAVYVNRILTDIVTRNLDEGVLMANAEAATIMRGYFMAPQHLVNSTTDAATKILHLRTQRLIDAVAIESIATGVVDMEAVKKLEGWMDHIGLPDSRARFEKIGAMSPIGRISAIESMANSDVREIAGRVNTNDFAIAAYMQELTEPQKAEFLEIDMPTAREPESPAFLRGP